MNIANGFQPGRELVCGLQAGQQNDIVHLAGLSATLINRAYSPVTTKRGRAPAPFRAGAVLLSTGRNPARAGSRWRFSSSRHAGWVKSPVPTSPMPLRRAQKSRCGASPSRLVAREKRNGCEDRQDTFAGTLCQNRLNLASLYPVCTLCATASPVRRSLLAGRLP